jgi:hypothetical protein
MYTGEGENTPDHSDAITGSKSRVKNYSGGGVGGGWGVGGWGGVGGGGRGGDLAVFRINWCKGDIGYPLLSPLN